MGIRTTGNVRITRKTISATFPASTSGNLVTKTKFKKTSIVPLDKNGNPQYHDVVFDFPDGRGETNIVLNNMGHILGTLLEAYDSGKYAQFDSPDYYGIVPMISGQFSSDFIDYIQEMLTPYTAISNRQMAEDILAFFPGWQMKGIIRNKTLSGID